MGKLETLEQIRAKFAGKKPEEEKPVKRCDKCQAALTIEQSKYFVAEVCENCYEYARITDRTGCCDVPEYHAVKMVTQGGTIQVKEQCKNCGNVRPNAIGGYDKDARQKLPEMDINAREQRQELYSKQYQEFYKQVNEKRNKKDVSRRDQIRNNWFKNYNNYLDSPTWREKRALVLRRDGNLCQCCLKNTATQVHHKSYEFVDLQGSEPAFDLVAICTPCHDKIEAMKEERRNKIQ